MQLHKRCTPSQAGAHRHHSPWPRALLLLLLLLHVLLPPHSLHLCRMRRRRQLGGLAWPALLLLLLLLLPQRVPALVVHMVQAARQRRRVNVQRRHQLRHLGVCKALALLPIQLPRQDG